jgi:hypothetical protein
MTVLDRIQLPPQYRYLQVPAKEGAIVDQSSREVTFSFSSEQPIKRINWDIWDYIYEVLDHSPESANLERCNSQAAPLLWNHNRDDQRGLVLKAWIDETDRRGYCTVKFGGRAAAEELMQDVNEGIIRNVSFMYRVHELTLDQIVEDGLDTYRSRDWEVVEISFCSIPADASVGVGRDANLSLNSVSIVVPNEFRSLLMTAQIPESTAELDRLRSELEESRKLVAELQLKDVYKSTIAVLKERATGLLNQRKLSTAAFESLFSETAIDEYLEDESRLSGLEFHINQLERFAIANSVLDEALGSGDVPPPPQERQQSSGLSAADFMKGYNPAKVY